jgi:SWI/SNF-related matrix-associated actin-dependent regulator 1 of chromatin subfamily A
MLITSKYPGNCRICSATIRVGDKVSWTRGVYGVTCVVCAPPTERQSLQKAEESIVASRKADADLVLDAPEGLTYLGYQRAGVAFALGRIGTLLGDEMGLGKTIQAIGVMMADTTIREALVVCPKSVALNWVREIRKWSTRSVQVDRIDGVPRGGAELRVLVVSYEEGKKQLAGLLRPWDCVIVDECHRMKNPKTQQSQMVASIAAQARKRLALTGTPIPNRTIEIFPIVKMLDPEEWDPQGKGFWRFAKRYAGAVNNGYGWDFTGATNLEELQERLRATVMVRRLKADVLTELPPKRRQIIEIPANGASKAVERESKAQAKHDEQMIELAARVELAKAGTEEEYKAAVADLRQAAQVAFEEVSRLRHDTAMAKVPHVIEHVIEALESAEGSKVIVFAHHLDVIARLREGLAEYGSVELTGQTSLEDRQAAVDRFQKDPGCRVFVGGIMAAGVGITLTAAAHVIFAELDWVPGNVTQAEDRAHRIGQSNSVLVQHLVLEESIDARMAKILVQKQEVADRALDCQVDSEPVVPVTSGAISVSRVELATEAPAIDAGLLQRVHDGLRRIAGMCDGACKNDGCGFSKVDAAIGHSLANATRLTPKQAALGLRLCRKYARQIGEVA